MNVGEKIKAIREKEGLTQQGLADKIGVSMRTVQRFERDENSSNIETLQKIANALKVKLSDIVGEGSELWWEMDFETFKKESPNFERMTSDFLKNNLDNKDQLEKEAFSSLNFALNNAPRDDEKKEAEYINRLAHIIRTYGVMSQHMCVVGLSSKERPDEYIRFMQNYERLLKLVREHKEDIIDGAFEWLKTLKESDTSKLEELIYGDDPK